MNCVHHWLCDEPIKGRVRAKCAKCPAETIFRPRYSKMARDGVTLALSVRGKYVDEVGDSESTLTIEKAIDIIKRELLEDVGLTNQVISDKIIME